MKLLKDKKVLVISSEVVPYLPQTEKAVNSFTISKKINDSGGMTRIFMPKYGIINERRHQLHEVIRLSGMNMIIDDQYMPLIIKVASIPKERMQVYFIDNEEYFKRKDLLLDKNEKLLKDNDEIVEYLLNKFLKKESNKKSVFNYFRKITAKLSPLEVDIALDLLSAKLNTEKEILKRELNFQTEEEFEQVGETSSRLPTAGSP